LRISEGEEEGFADWGGQECWGSGRPPGPQPDSDIGGRAGRGASPRSEAPRVGTPGTVRTGPPLGRSKMPPPTGTTPTPAPTPPQTLAPRGVGTHLKTGQGQWAQGKAQPAARASPPIIPANATPPRVHPRGVSPPDQDPGGWERENYPTLPRGPTSDRHFSTLFHSGLCGCAGILRGAQRQSLARSVAVAIAIAVAVGPHSRAGTNPSLMRVATSAKPWGSIEHRA
jgi:hypothetical protein